MANLPNEPGAAGRERMRLVYKPARSESEIELPLRLLFVGDFVGRDERPVEERLPVRVDRASFDRVLAAHAPTLDFVVHVPDASNGDGAVRARLAFTCLADFGPDAVASQIPETGRLLALRDALSELKGSGDVPAFRAVAATLFEDDGALAQLLSELGLESLR